MRKGFITRPINTDRLKRCLFALHSAPLHSSTNKQRFSRLVMGDVMFSRGVVLTKKLNVIFGSLILLLCTSIANAKSEQSAASICEPREPIINYEKAVEIAKNELKKYMQVDESFIDLISLDCQNRKNIWSIGFRRKAHESGHFVIKVNPDSTTHLSIVKDR